MSEWIDCKSASGDDKAMMFGEEFRYQLITRARFDGGVQMVELLLNGCLVMLVGDPQRALATYLVGRNESQVAQ